MVEENLTPLLQAQALRQRAIRCRNIAREYHPSVGAPLYETAVELEREAARLLRGNVERRALFKH